VCVICLIQSFKHSIFGCSTFALQSLMVYSLATGVLLRWTISSYTTFGKRPVWKDPMVESNFIPPQLNMWYMVYIGGTGVLLAVFSWWHK
jgi:hypothetical protein